MRLVSIPERVLGWLKLVSALRLEPVVRIKVSIPERVLGWLKHYMLRLVRF